MFLGTCKLTNIYESRYFERNDNNDNIIGIGIGMEQDCLKDPVTKSETSEL